MFLRAHTKKRAALVSWAWVALGCLLSFTSSFNLTVLADVLDRNFPSPHDRFIEEVEEDIDEDANMLRASSESQDGRRGERKHTTACPVLPAEPSLCRSSRPTQAIASPTARPGSEHALRNGLGVPLLC